MALQEAGESTCTLGEVKNRADLVIFWGSDPVESHPRHLERYSRRPGRRVRPARPGRPHGRRRRRAADGHQRRGRPVPAGRAGPRLRGAVDAARPGPRPARRRPGAATGAPADCWPTWPRRMKACRFGVVFFGLGLSRRARAPHRRGAAAAGHGPQRPHALLRPPHARLRATWPGPTACWPGRRATRSASTWLAATRATTPASSPAQDMLLRGEVDACLLVGSEGVRRFAPEARRPPCGASRRSCSTGRRPTRLFAPTVRFTTAVYGVHRPGTAYRMDEVPIPLRVVLPTRLPERRGGVAGDPARLEETEERTHMANREGNEPAPLIPRVRCSARGRLDALLGSH